MATDFERMSVPTRAIEDTRTMGGAPRDGDFARLLQAASQPAAHRLHAAADSMVSARTAAPQGSLSAASERRDVSGSLLGRWLAMPMRERVITGLFTLGGIAFVLNILSSAIESADDGFGVLLVVAVIVFFILSARSRKSRGAP